MFNIGFFKALPTEYVLKYVSGRVARAGMGLTFFYLKYNTQVAAIPTSSTDVNFVFNELTSNFQAVTIQGQFTYRIIDPQQAAQLLNFAIIPSSHRYLSDDPQKLPQRITNIVQAETRTSLQTRSLEAALREGEQIAIEVLRRIREGMLLEPLGVELLSLYFVTVRPTPEVAKALEAEYRETLLRKQDQAIYVRRAAAVEEERKIKENELQTAVILEQERQQLIELEGANALQQAELQGQAVEREAEYKARGLEKQIEVYRKTEPAAIMALAMRDLGENNSIGSLTITSEILASVLNALPVSKN